MEAKLNVFYFNDPIVNILTLMEYIPKRKQVFQGVLLRFLFKCTLLYIHKLQQGKEMKHSELLKSEALLKSLDLQIIPRNHNNFYRLVSLLYTFL